MEVQQKASVCSKRKKKKRKTKEPSNDTGGSREKTSQATDAIAKRSTGLPPAAAPSAPQMAVKKLEDQSSSSSSVDNHKPQSKMRKYEESSSDATSIGRGASSTVQRSSTTAASTAKNHLEPSSVRQHKHDSSTTLLINGDTIRRPTAGSTVTATLPNGLKQKQTASPIHKNGSSLLSGSMTHKLDSATNGSSVHLPKLPNGTSSSRPRYRSDKCSGAEDVGVCSMLESLRWDHALLDEEAEKARLEVYKTNRRKRYQTALEKQQKPVLITRLTTKNG